MFAVSALALNALVGDRGLVERWRAKQAMTRLEAELTALRADNASLRARIERLAHDAVTIEALARQQLGLVRRGELLVLVKDRAAR